MPSCAFSIPKSSGRAARTEAGRADSPVRGLGGLHPDGTSSSRCLTSCHAPVLGHDELGCSRTVALGGAGLSSLFLLHPCQRAPETHLHPHDLPAAMQETPRLRPARGVSHGPARSCYRRSITWRAKRPLQSVQTPSTVCWAGVAERSLFSGKN